MTIGFGIKVFFEIVVILLIGYGVMHEDKLIDFEEEFFPVLKFCFHKYVLKDIKRKNKTPVSKQKKVLKNKATFSVVSGKKTVRRSGRNVA